MSVPWIAEAMVATVPVVAGSWFAYKAAARAARMTASASERAARSQVEADAYLRAKAIYESALGQLEEQLGRMQLQLDKLNDQLARERDTSADLRSTIRTLEEQVQMLERTVAVLRRQIARAPIDAADAWDPGENPGP